MQDSNKANPYVLPPNLPVPADDGAAARLPDQMIPDVRLQGIDGREWNLHDLARDKAVFYVYPATGVPGRDPIAGWDDIPGAPGCTIQSIGYRDHHAELQALGFQVIGISAQLTEEQQEFAHRVVIPFPLLSDPQFRLAELLGLPTFEASGHRFYKRLALVVENGVIRHVTYPVFPPDRNAETVLAWLRAHRK